jgi:hypothetical protein
VEPSQKWVVFDWLVGVGTATVCWGMSRAAARWPAKDP